ncbi:MAG: DUF488 domain-containing protein [Phycisphaeraceae bacterium]
MADASIEIKRIYDEPSESDGLRVLVDRVWPRGVSKSAARLDAWERVLAPSDDLRRWFDHDPARFEAFRAAYAAELKTNRVEVDRCVSAWRGKRVTLLYGARDTEHNQAVVLRDVLRSLL